MNVATPEDHSASCDQRRYVYDESAGPEPLETPDLEDCKTLLGAPGIPSEITPLNDGLATLQFQSLSFNPKDPANDVLGGTQDNGTWSYTARRPGSRASAATAGSRASTPSTRPSGTTTTSTRRRR